MEQFREFLATLNERQREAVLATEGPLMVLAGAGSGKTKMLTSRMSYLMLAKNVPGLQILAVTFTNKAAEEMRERVERNLQFGSGLARGGRPEIGTFHSICVRLLRWEMPHLPFTKPFVIYDDADQLSLIKSVLKGLNIDEKSMNPKSIQSVINRAKCDAKEPQHLDLELKMAGSAHAGRRLQMVYEKYQEQLVLNNALDFGEILCMAYRLLRDHEEVRKRYQQRFRYIHVDEYQDTNRVQYLLLSLLASPKHGGHQNICVVGDEDQSIYKWRGADIRNILDFEREFIGAKVVKLEQNYRSTKAILRASNEVIQNNHQGKAQWNGQQHIKKLWTENDEGEKVIWTQLYDEREEAEEVIGEIQSLARKEGRSYRDFAIFYRTHAQSRQFEDVLRREKIPYQMIGGLKFYDRKEIKDVLAYFRLILNLNDLVSLKRVINVPARGIGKTTIEKLDQLYYQGLERVEGRQSYWEVLEKAAYEPSLVSLSAGTSKKLRNFVELVKRFVTEQPKLWITELYHLILDETGYVRTLKEEGTEEALARIENLEEFDTLLQEFEEDQLKHLSEGGETSKEHHSESHEESKQHLLAKFIEQTSLATDVDRRPGVEGEGGENVSSVTLMTLHSSKGLEFPVVFMVGMEEGLFPSIRSIRFGGVAYESESPESKEEIEEERRLCYVGMTRARQLLYLSSVSLRRIWGDLLYQRPSRFFAEISPENLSR